MKKAIIIGATSGIGRSLALLLAENGYRVGLTGRRTHLLEELRAEKPGEFFIQTLDVSDTANVSGKLQELVHALGGLDLLILSAGTGDINDKLDFDIEKTTINTNVSGFTAVAGWAFNYFCTQKHGHLAAISSVAGLRGNSAAPSYSATKAYQINYLEGLRIKSAKTGLPVYITDIRPGFIDTEMAKGDGLFWVAPVDKAANQTLKAIYRKRNIAYVTKRWQLVAFVLSRLPKAFINRI